MDRYYLSIGIYVLIVVGGVIWTELSGLSFSDSMLWVIAVSLIMIAGAQMKK